MSKQKILALLKQTEGYLSGGEVSRQLGISRSTLWRYLGRCAEKKPARADEKRE